MLTTPTAVLWSNLGQLIAYFGLGVAMADSSEMFERIFSEYSLKVIASFDLMATFDCRYGLITRHIWESPN